MSRIALYRKYRPQDFAQVIGQNFVVQTLKLSIINNKLSHAYIFAGARGTGKTSIAKIFAKAINCLDPHNGDCCNKCANCLIANSNQAIDIIELDAASNNGVEEMRSIIETIPYLPTQFKYKVYIIDEAHMLSTSAWNALLKSIEEPPQHAIFIFATTEFNKIPMTIISRCQRYDFHKLTTEELKSLIDKVCQSENISIDEDAKAKVALLSDGGARDCLSILDQLATYTDNHITMQAINQVFGLVNLDFKIQLLNTLMNPTDNTELWNLIEQIKSNNIDYLALGSDLINYLLDKIIYTKTNNENLLKYLSSPELEAIHGNQDIWFNLIDQFTQMYENIKKYGNGSFYLEMALLRGLNLRPVIHVSPMVNTPSPTVNSPKTVSKPFIESTPITPTISTPEPVTNIDTPYNPSINLNDTFSTVTVTNQYKKPASIPSLIDDEFSVQAKDSDNFNHLVSADTKPINPYLDKDVLKTASQKSSENIPDLDWMNIFMQCAKNNQKDLKEQLNTELTIFKNKQGIYSAESKILIEADKILIASANACILLFNFKNEAKRFNQLFWTKVGYAQFKNLLLNNQDKLIYGIDKKTAKEWTEIYKQRKSESFSDVDLDILKPIRSQSGDELKQNILDILGSDLKIKN